MAAQVWIQIASEPIVKEADTQAGLVMHTITPKSLPVLEWEVLEMIRSIKGLLRLHVLKETFPPFTTSMDRLLKTEW